ncbi:DsbA family protein [Brytella acorum]|uniref:Thioredoxin n=1 Tax=Brytella acorum TaxID=2959299 RepID=A0AA35UJQ2_9PROT|nr:thioredoxin [Brytella acorum]MDF3625854.1 thioredoxin [Brytella acorum]CAI9121592.1 thioredoxin [Brytella acorum]
MTGQTKTWRADPLTWGHGPRIFEIFVEPTCPFSVRALGKLDALLDQAGPDRVTIRIRLQSQPWHMFSGVVTRCVIAASTLSGGREDAKRVLTAVGAHREAFEFTHHAGGPNMESTPDDIIARIEAFSGLKLAEAFAIPDLDTVIKWHCKYARQNGIHVSPTFMIDGLIDPAISSGDAVSDWVARLTTETA